MTLFHKETLAKCKEVLQIRKASTLKYSDTTLPEKANSKDGFHMACYRRFIGLSEKHRKKLSQDAQKIQTVEINQEEEESIHPIESKSNRLLRSNINSPKFSKG